MQETSVLGATRCEDLDGQAQPTAGEVAALAVEVLPLPVMVVGRNGTTVIANRALRALLGVTEVAGRPARFLSRGSGWQRLWRLVAEPGPGASAVVALEDASGRRRHFEVVVAKRGVDGDAVVSLHDVTAVRAAGQQLVAKDRLLATAELQLRAAHEELGLAERQLSQLVTELEATAG